MTGMELEFYNAAKQGNIEAFQGMGEQIESILTPNKNTMLHLHFTNYADSVSETFAEEVLGTSPALFFKINMKGETILHRAVRYGHQKILKKLIDCAKVLPRDINEVGSERRLIRAINDKKDTALHEAARYGHTEGVDFLVKEEPDHSYFGKNVADETPLYIAVERKYWNVVDTILNNSDNSLQNNGPNGRIALHAAVLHGDAEKVSKLLERNLLAAKQADENGWVPLHLVAIATSFDVVELLASKDRSTAYMRDNKGRMALHFVVVREDSSVMEKIIKYCTDCCELVDEKGSNAPL
ncbi:ankyrin repeat-containing protein At2g01680-like [Neltuma alba]|uniref:ankyrin repeat-containing protein At2g01680-like n=1 Tax=Neltuma alba TaxID=207710 RepID=UPI0010A2F8B1|nr:ankyrin repeat-containing protein At2g01680-like [Prosopis alba]